MQPEKRAALLSVGFGNGAVPFSEKKRNTPNARQSNDRIYYSADDGIGTAEQPSDNIKLKKSDTAPVERADYCEYKANSVKH